MIKRFKRAFPAELQENSLIYVKNINGIQRRKQGKSFVYYGPNGKKITDLNILDRIQSLGIPPAYTKVWICPEKNGHIQAIGRDSKNRKQYIYHPLWIKMREDEKFKSLLAFGSSLPLLRKKINEEINKPPSLNKTQIICAILFLVDNFSLRIGNNIYAKTNQTYGVTTLRKKHIQYKKDSVSFKFLGKNKHLWSFEVDEYNVVQILKRCGDIPGYDIFKYYNEKKEIEVLTSQDVNEYLYSVTQHHFTAKDFRTWIATREFFSRVLKQLKIKKLHMKSIKKSLLEVSNLLGHTPTICKSSYIHPQIWEWINNGKLVRWSIKNKKNIQSKHPEEILILWLEAVYFQHTI